MKLPVDANTDKRNVNFESAAMFLQRGRKNGGTESPQRKWPETESNSKPSHCDANPLTAPPCRLILRVIVIKKMRKA